MADNILNTEVEKIVIFVELKDKTVRQVITRPEVKFRAIQFIAHNSPDGALNVGAEEENIEFTVFNEKNIPNENSR